MSVDGLHDQIDNLQEQKLSQDTWGDRDTPIEDLANRAIDTAQKTLSQVEDEGAQQEGLQRLISFLNELGGEFNNNDYQSLLEVLTPQDTTQDFSLENGRIMLGADGYDVGKTIMEDILYRSDFLAQMSKEDILQALWKDMKYTHDSKGWNSVDPKMQGELTQKTEEIYKKLGDFGFTEVEIDSYMVFGPKLLGDIKDEKVRDYYSDPENKQIELSQLTTQEEKMYFMRVWDFMSLDADHQMEMLASNSDFANNLRRYGVTGIMDSVEIYNFSESQEVIKKKTEIFDMIAEKCDGEELEQMVVIYSTYLEYAGESSQDIDTYLLKIQDFQEMLEDEFDGGINISGFIERCSRFLPKSMRGMAGFLRRIKQSVTANPLESAIFAASFCPYAGDCLDILYGTYKYTNGVNFSGEKIQSGDALMQAGFGCIGLGMNCLFPGGGSIIKVVKGFTKATPEFQTIKKISEKLAQYFPDIIKILSDTSKGIFEIIKNIKIVFMEKILPVFRNDFNELHMLIKNKLA